MTDSLDQIFSDSSKLINLRRDLRLMELFASEPGTARLAVERIFREFPDTPPFLGTAILGLDPADFAPLARLAVENLRHGPQKSSEKFVAYASQQALSSLKPYLRELFDLRPNSSSYYAMWPWRESGMAEFEFLRERVGGTDGAAAKALFETREQKCMRFLSGRLPKKDFKWNASRVGFERRVSGFRQLYSEQVFHLAFPAGHFDGIDYAGWLPMSGLQTHAEDGQHLLGGDGKGECSVCGKPLAHVMTLDCVPDGLGVLEPKRLSIQACLTCVATQTLFYKHDAKGDARALESDEEPWDTEVEKSRLRPVRVDLVRTPARWKWQDWALSNGRENLNRVGGHPTWIQEAAYPACPECKATMVHLLQLDSTLPAEDGDVAYWGGDGICYVAWCDTCKVSGIQTQYT